MLKWSDVIEFDNRIKPLLLSKQQRLKSLEKKIVTLYD